MNSIPSRDRDAVSKTGDGLMPIVVMGFLIAFAFFARVIAIVALRSWQEPEPMEHRSLARNLLDGHGFAFNEWGFFGPSSVQSPPYPLFLAGLYWLFGMESTSAYIAAMVLNALVGAGTVWLTYLLARTLSGAVAVGLVAAFLVAIWPTQIYSVTHAQAVVWITAAVVGVIYLFSESVQSGRLRPWIGFSVVGCLAALIEPALLPPMVLSGILILIWPSEVLDYRTRLKNALVLLVMAFLILGPWSVRNRLVHGAWIPIKSTFWVNVWKGNNQNATGTDRLPLSGDQLEQLNGSSWWRMDSLIRKSGFDSRHQYELLTEQQLERITGKPEREREEVFRSMAVEWIRSNPFAYFKLCLVRLFKTVVIEWDNPKSRNPIYLLSRLGFLMLVLPGLILALRRRWHIGYAMIVFAFCLLLYATTITAARFIIPFEPVGLICGALLLTTIGQMFCVAKTVPNSSTA